MSKVAIFIFPSKEEIAGLSPSQRAKLATQLMDVANQLVRSIAG